MVAIPGDYNVIELARYEGGHQALVGVATMLSELHSPFRAFIIPFTIGYLP